MTSAKDQRDKKRTLELLELHVRNLFSQLEELRGRSLERKSTPRTPGWCLRQIQKATHIRRETASQYLKAAEIAVRPPRGWGRQGPKPATEVITDFGAGKPAIARIPDRSGHPKSNPENLSTKGKANSTPANEVITDSKVITDPQPVLPDEVSAFSRKPSLRNSDCTAYSETIELGLRRGRNAMAIWQDLVSEYGFTSS